MAEEQDFGEFKISKKPPVVEPQQTPQNEGEVDEITAPNEESGTEVPKEEKEAVVNEEVDKTPEVVNEGVDNSEVKEEESKSNTDNDDAIVLVDEEEGGSQDPPSTPQETPQESVSEVVQDDEPVEDKELEYPEDVKKLMDFLQKTGGTIQDYANLNQDFDSMSEDVLVRKYLQETKSYLSPSELNDYISDNYSYDEDVDDERDVRKKKLAYKEIVHQAKGHFKGLKDQYYNDIESKSVLPPEAEEAIKFVNDYKSKQEKEAKEQSRKDANFREKTDKLFNDDFKGFDFKIDGKKYRRTVKDVSKVKEAQSDFGKALKPFLDETGALKDAEGFHKSLYAFLNPDKLAEQFYQQGFAEAIKQNERASKNIQMDKRKNSSEFVDAGGVKVRVVDSGQGSQQFKIRK